MTTTLFLADGWEFFANLGSTALMMLILASIFWIWAIIDAATNPRLDGIQRIVWLLVIGLLHLIGAILYTVAGRGTVGRLRTS